MKSAARVFLTLALVCVTAATFAQSWGDGPGWNGCPAGGWCKKKSVTYNTPTLVQHQNALASNGFGWANFTNNTAGDLIVAVVGQFGSNTQPITAPSDTAGNTYTLATNSAAVTSGGTAEGQISIYYVLSCLTFSGTNQVQSHATGGAALEIMISEWSGGAWHFDAANNLQSGSASPVLGVTTTKGANELMITGGYNINGAWTNDATWTALENYNDSRTGTWQVSQYKLSGSPATYNWSPTVVNGSTLEGMTLGSFYAN